MINSRIETEELIVYLEPEIIEDVSEVPNLTYIVENNSEEQLPVSHGLIEFYDEAADEWVDSGIMIVSDMMMRYVEPSETFSREIPTEQMADEEDGLYRLAVAVGEEEFLLEFYKGEVSR
uniref:hypothetical protein n=1 Tax=Candidatus Enterococcus willemsii TaxID=1857215 RepID=UPI00403FBFC8